MAQLKTALPLSAIEKMAVEYLLNPRSLSHIHHNKPGMAYEIWRLVNSTEGPYAHIKKNFHDKRVVAWIKFCIDALIKKNVLVQEEDTYRSLRLSDDYLVQQTQDFSLDESVTNSVQLISITNAGELKFNEAQIRKEIIEIIATHSDHDFDAGDIVDIFVYGTDVDLDVESVEIFVKSLVNQMAKEGILSCEDDRHGWRIVKINPDYLEKETENFNLDESKIKKNPRYVIHGEYDDDITFNEDAVRDDILKWVVTYGDDNIDENDIVTCIFNDWPLIEDLNDYTNPLIEKTRDYLLKLIDKMIDDGIFEKSQYQSWEVIKIAPGYLENETKDFNLDESVDSSIISPAIQQMIINFIIEKLSSLPEDEEGHSVDFLVFMLSRKFFGVEAHREERIVRKIVKELIDEEKIIVINHDIWEEVRISPEFVAKETANFNLDEARYFNVENDEYDFDEQAIIDLIIKEVKWRMIHGPNLSINGYVRFIGDRISPYSGITSHATPCKEFAFLCIKKLLKQNILTEKPNVNGANVIMLSDEYLEHETENFTLDESVDNSADKQRFFVFDDKGRIHFDEEKSRARIFNSTADFMTSDTLASINDIIMDVFDEYHNETVNWPFAASCAAEDYFAALIVKMEKEGILTIDGPGDFDRNVRINDDYLEKETSDFNLDS